MRKALVPCLVFNDTGYKTGRLVVSSLVIFWGGNTGNQTLALFTTTTTHTHKKKVYTIFHCATVSAFAIFLASALIG